MLNKSPTITTNSNQNLEKAIQSNHGLWTQWRQYLHANPETAFEEFNTSAFVAEKLESFGIEVHKGLAITGVVGVLKKGTSSKSIGLRADMDALDIEELNTFDYISKKKGKMHACGHDGHTIMLLATAQYLSGDVNFDGTVYFIFQPAEENVAGGKVMIDDGLFEQFPADMVFGIHNWPNIETGHIATRVGALMASNDTFEITVHGKSVHGAMPEQGIDPIIIGANIITQLNMIVSRLINPIDSAVISVTQIHAGSAWNVIPDSCVIRGTVRAFSPEVRKHLQHHIINIAENCASGFGTTSTIDYNLLYVPTINTPETTKIAIAVATECIGSDKVHTNIAPTMAGEDFGYMIDEVGGTYVWLGNGDSASLHNSKYDFNDEIIPVGVKYFVNLVETILK